MRACLLIRCCPALVKKGGSKRRLTFLGTGAPQPHDPRRLLFKSEEGHAEAQVFPNADAAPRAVRGAGADRSMDAGRETGREGGAAFEERQRAAAQVGPRSSAMPRAEINTGGSAQGAASVGGRAGNQHEEVQKETVRQTRGQNRGNAGRSWGRGKRRGEARRGQEEGSGSSRRWNGGRAGRRGGGRCRLKCSKLLRRRRLRSGEGASRFNLDASPPPHPGRP